MDPVTSFSASATARYQTTPRNTALGDEPQSRGAAAAGTAQPLQQTSSATTVTLSSRAQELASQRQEVQPTQQTVESSGSATDARRTPAPDAAEQAAQQTDASSARAQADAQLRRAYAGAEGSFAR